MYRREASSRSNTDSIDGPCSRTEGISWQPNSPACWRTTSGVSPQPQRADGLTSLDQRQDKATATMYGPMPAPYVEMFSARVRYSGTSMGYQLRGIVGGGFTPLILTAILAASNSSTGISLYIILAAVATLVCTAFISIVVMDDVIPEASPTPSSPVINEKASETAGLGLAKSATTHTL